MPDKPSDLVQGTLDRLILKTLALEPMHGYGISVRIEQMSRGGVPPQCRLVISRDSTITERWANRRRREAHRERPASEVLRSDGEGTQEAQ